LALIGDSVGQSALEACAIQQNTATRNTNESGSAPGAHISNYGLLTYLFLACIFLTDSADLALISRLAKTVVLDPPVAYLHATLPVFVFIPAIAASFLGSYSSSRLGRFKTLSWSAIGRVLAITVFVLTLKYGDFSRWQALVFISVLSALCAYAFVPRLCWMIDMRKLSFARFCHLLLLGSAWLLSITMAQQAISTITLCQLALVSTACASIGFRILARGEKQPEQRKDNLLRLSSLIAAKSLPILTLLSFWSCLALASFEQYQPDESSLFTFAAASCLGIACGAALPLLRLTAGPSYAVSLACGVLSTLLLVAFGFFGNWLTPQLFFFLFLALSVASFTGELSWPKGSLVNSQPASKLVLERSVAWGQALVLATAFLICLATFAGIDTTSSALQLRKFALVTGVVSLVALAFTRRSLAWQFKFH
jgi:hypothetical protein